MNSNEREIVLTEEGVEVNETNYTEDGVMTSVNWKQKLSSRKLWAAVLAALFSVAVAVFGDELDAEMVEILKTGIYGLIAYIFGEGAVDIVRIIGQSKVDAVSSVPININFKDDTEGDE